LFYFFFFFSSRRRHTRSKRDWSSDVCSSDLVAKLATPFTAASVVVPPSVLPPGLVPSATVTLPVKLGTGFPAASSAVTWTAGLRSEERRVGKEGRSRWAPEQERKNRSEWIVS